MWYMFRLVARSPQSCRQLTMKGLLLVSLAIGVCSATIARRSNGCGSSQLLTADHGTIVSHGGYAAGHHYGKHLDCSWTIEAPMGKYVEVWPEAFDIMGRFTCSYDYLELLDGNSINSKRMGKYCGSHMDPISSTQNFLTLHFVTDGSLSRAGFKLHYNFTDVIVHECKSYQVKCNNSNCIPRRYLCDGEDDCGDDSDEQGCAARPNTTTAISGSSRTCSAAQFRCDGTRCVPRRWVCDGDDDCHDRSDEDPRNCHLHVTSNTTAMYNPPQCGQLNRTGSTGNITSPHYPSNYENHVHCRWTIQGPITANTISFHFDSVFGMENSTTCFFDYVKVYAELHAYPHGPFCGRNTPAPFDMPVNYVIVEFKSDISNNFQGFRLNWEALCK